MGRVLQMPRDTQSGRYLRIAALALVCISFVDMLYCTLGYEFGWGPMTVLVGPADRFADLIKLSLSYRSVTEGVDTTPSFHSWNPLYQNYYKHPIYGELKDLDKGQLTNLHLPPLAAVVLLSAAEMIVHTGSPVLVLFLFFGLYLLGVSCIVWVGIPPDKKTWEVASLVFFFCLASYPALVMFGRANYVDAGMTVVPVLLFMVSIFSQRQASLASILALAIGVNIHPNAVIFSLAFPLVLGIRRAIKPCIQFIVISVGIFVASCTLAHMLDPAYTFAHFLKGVAIYEKFYVHGPGGEFFGSTPYIFFRLLGHGLPFAWELRTYLALCGLLFFFIAIVFWRALIWRRTHSTIGRNNLGCAEEGDGGFGGPMSCWPFPLVPFLLTAFYCIVSPVMADYHLLVFLGPLLLACLGNEVAKEHRAEWMAVVICSVLMLSPKNYSFDGFPLQVVLNPLILCGTVLWLGLRLLQEPKRNEVSSVVD